MIYSISPIHTFVNIPALLLKNTLRFLIRAGIFTKGRRLFQFGSKFPTRRPGKSDPWIWNVILHWYLCLLALNTPTSKNLLLLFDITSDFGWISLLILFDTFLFFFHRFLIWVISNYFKFIYSILMCIWVHYKSVLVECCSIYPNFYLFISWFCSLLPMA